MSIAQSFTGPITVTNPVTLGVYEFAWDTYGGSHIWCGFLLADGTTQSLAYGTDWTTASLEYQNGGGSIQLLAAVPTGAQLIIDRETIAGQDTTLTAQEQAIERMSDRHGMVLQEVTRRQDWQVTPAADAIELSPSSKRHAMTVPAATTSVAGLMSAADKTLLDGMSQSVVSTGNYIYQSYAQVVSTTFDAVPPFIITQGRAAAGDGGHGLYLPVASAPAHGGLTDASGNHYELQPVDGYYNGAALGALGSGSDESVAIQAGLDLAVAKGGNVRWPKREYLAEGLSFNSLEKKGVTLDFSGSKISQINSGNTVLSVGGNFIVVENLTIDSHDGQPGSDELIQQTRTFRGVFRRVMLGFFANQGRWALRTNGAGGIYWCSYFDCGAYWVIDPRLTSGYGAFNSSINANSWFNGLASGIVTEQPAASVSGQSQDMYANTFFGTDLDNGLGDGLGDWINNYTTDVGNGTQDDYFITLRDCTSEGQLNFVGPWHGEVINISARTGAYPYDQNYPRRRMRMAGALGVSQGDYEPSSVRDVMRATPREGVPDMLASDFNGAWSVVTNAAEKAPSGDAYYRWIKASASGQGAPKIIVPKDIVRSAAYNGALTVAFFAKAVTGVLGAATAYKYPSENATAAISTSAVFAESDAADAEGWVQRWATVPVPFDYINTDNDLGILLSGINLGATAEYYFGAIEVYVGRVAYIPAAGRPSRKVKTLDHTTDNTWLAAWTITPPTRGSVGYRATFKTQGSGQATASMISVEVLVSQYDGGVACTLSTPLINGTVSNGALNGVQYQAAAPPAVTIEFRIETWSPTQTFPVECTLLPLDGDGDALAYAV